MTDETLIEWATRLQAQIDKAKQFHSGKQLSQRIEGDLNRIINSAWLNLADAIYLHEQQTGERNHICLLSKALNSDRCLICGEEIQYPEGWKDND